MLSPYGERLMRTSFEAGPSLGTDKGLSEVADVARRAGALVEQALGVRLDAAGAEGAPLVSGPTSRAVTELRSLMVGLVVSQRARWRGAADGGGVLGVRTEPVEGAPAWLRVVLAFGGATRELRLPIAGAMMPEHGRALTESAY
ncbi:MAG TPA: hypothetical protein VFX49_09850 [Chloroflexota bacterium]|nr:hypothetical protein [Chloroflexota bacterium]